MVEVKLDGRGTYRVPEEAVRLSRPERAVTETVRLAHFIRKHAGNRFAFACTGDEEGPYVATARWDDSRIVGTGDTAEDAIASMLDTADE